MSDQRSSDCDQSKRDIPSFIEPRPPLILNPFMRPRPQKGTNLLELFEEDSESEEPELVQVYLRLKPCNVRSNLYEVKSDRCLITSVDTAPMGHGRRTQHNVSKMYTFSHIFGPECDQKQIFEQVVKENLKKLPEGHNFTLLTYGASGSGKTFTLMGTVQSPGLVPRSLEYVFRVVDAAQQPLYKPVDGDAVKLDYYEQDSEIQFVRRLRQVSAPLRDKYRRMSAQLRNDLTASTLDLSNRTRYYVWVSFVEIYNEAIYDLLSNSDRSKATSKLRIREDTNGHVYVKGATQAFVRSGSEAYDVLVAGKHNLQVAATGVHANSSRSHCIFTISMLTETESGVHTSCVRLCDLAGCERQRHARNTGARMQESRAINSSLHVLERCLHMLRRKQKKIDATLVPYRESKLTRLLGAGLSGARGEAVSMVVTLNPAPQYAHETRHVLQLAAVAKDIQVNQTIQESTFESSTQDSTIEPSVDFMRLRSENERLHFELVQAQARNKELLAAMEEKQAEVATTMFEIVEEAKDMTRQYYETQLQALRAEMEEMQEEYESKLKALAGDGETLARPDQNKVAELMTEIAILEEKLTAEKLARARAEDEVQHLRACIDERDEKAEQDSGQNHEDVMSITDESEDEKEDDPWNESLEPTFKKEDINRSRLLQQSLINESKHDIVDDDQDTINDDQSTINDDNISVIDDEKNKTLKDDDDEREETVKDSTYLSDESNVTEKVGQTQDIELNNSKVESAKEVKVFDETIEFNNTKSSAVRGTFVVRDDMFTSNEETKQTTPKLSNVLSSIENTKKSFANMEESLENELEKSMEQCIDRMADKITNVIANKLFIKPSIPATRSDVSLANFEQLEIASKFDNSKPKPVEPLETFSNIKLLKEKRNYFDDDYDPNDLIPKETKNSKTPYFDDINVENKNLTDVKIHLNDERSPSIVKEDFTDNIEPSTMKKLLGESFSRQPDRLSAVTTISLPKKQASVDIFEGFDSPNVMKAKETPEIEILISHSLRKDETNNYDNKYGITESVEVQATSSTKTSNLSETINKERSDIFVKPKEVQKPSTVANESLTQPKSDTSILENCIEKKASLCQEDTVGDTCRSIQRLCLQSQSDHKAAFNNIKIKIERPSVEPQNNDISVSSKDNENQSTSQINCNNTIEYFDIMYKDITPRATEFEQLISQNNTNFNESKFEIEKENDKLKYNLRHTKANTSLDKKEVNTEVLDEKEKSFNKKMSNHKKNTSVNKKKDICTSDTSVDKTIFFIDKQDSQDKTSNTLDVVLLESEAKCESKAKPKRNLRLRRRKDDSDDKTEKENVKLKDIVNLQKEFSDVTMDVPAPFKKFKDIESPEKRDEENLPPLLEIQSCPSKSVTRSRRKLFTPRAEPLEECMGQSGDSNERIRVPRPSYHRTRARRKL